MKNGNVPTSHQSASDAVVFCARHFCRVAFRIYIYGYESIFTTRVYMRKNALENGHFGFDSSVIWNTAGSARAIFEVHQAHTIGKSDDKRIENRVTGEKSRSLPKPAHNTIHTLCTTNGSPYQSEWSVYGCFLVYLVYKRSYCKQLQIGMMMNECFEPVIPGILDFRSCFDHPKVRV